LDSDIIKGMEDDDKYKILEKFIDVSKELSDLKQKYDYLEKSLNSKIKNLEDINGGLVDEIMKKKNTVSCDVI